MTQEQLDRLDDCYHKYNLDDQCDEERVNARKLLCGNRFDLYAILLYIDHKVKGVKDMSYAISVYKERTRAITGFKFSEYGNNQKNDFDDFLNVLDGLIEDFSNGNFDIEKTLVPVDKNYVLIDGAHRTACAAYFNADLKILRFLDVNVNNNSYLSLINRLMPWSVADSIALESLKWHDNLFMLILWPKAFLQKENVEKATKMIELETDVMYVRDLTMQYNDIRNLMLQLYGHMNWVGNIDNDFASTYSKADEVWDNCASVRFVMVRAGDCQQVLNLKNRIRDLFGIGLASIHSTDTMLETSMAANAVFNPNSRHFIHNGNPTKFKKSYKMFEKFRSIAINNNIDRESIIIDSGMSLAVYGVRETSDLDFLSLPETQTGPLLRESEFEEHDSRQKSFYPCPVSELIEIPANYFTYYGIKFVALNKLLQMKQKRLATDKDIKDIKDIKRLLNDTGGKFRDGMSLLSASIRRKYRLIKRSINSTRNSILKSIGIYDSLKSLKNKILGIKQK